MSGQQCSGPVDSTRSPYARWRTLPSGASLTGGFWSRWQATNRRVSLRHGYRMLEESGSLHDLRLAIGEDQGEFRGPVFMDSDVYKWLEAVSYELANQPDAELDALADETISLLERVQMPDGYLNSYYQIVKPDQRWTNLREDHEMYCAGHLIQAAVAHHRATGKTSLLDIARRFADHIDSVFGPGKRQGTPGHPEIEMALVELYRVTGEQRYLSLAGFLVDQRGYGLLGQGRFAGPYYQDRVPVREASALVGHAVRQLYLTAGVTDLFLETGEQELYDAMMRQWHDLTAHKLYITGGVGARHQGESFGEMYELPNDRAYSETCAAIASIMWNWRLLLATGCSRYADLMERTLYNGFLSGVSVDGLHYFYVNPLLSRGTIPELGRGGHRRLEWHGCACCPPNVMRLFASLGHYFATQDENGVQVHLYDAGVITADLAGGPVRVSVDTAYPWEGRVQFMIEASGTDPWRLALRLPGWCSQPTLMVNERPVTPVLEDGYAVIERSWQRGDTVVLDLPVEPRLIEANPRVEPARDSVAIERGPLVYCLEQCDQVPGADVLAVEIDEEAPLAATWQDELLGGMLMVEGSGFALEMAGWEGELYRPLNGRDERQPVRLSAVPYYAWANREPGSMRVWIPRKR